MAQIAENESITQLAAQRELLRKDVAKLSALDDEASLRFETAKPEMPEEIFVKGLDDRMTLDTSWFRPPLQYAAANKLRQYVPAEGWQAMLAEPPKLFGSDEVNECALERIRVGLAAAERYEELVHKADVEAGYSAAADAEEEARQRLDELDDAILALPARSMGDLLLQVDVLRANMKPGCELPDAMVEGLIASIEALGGRRAA